MPNVFPIICWILSFDLRVEVLFVSTYWEKKKKARVNILTHFPHVMNCTNIRNNMNPYISYFDLDFNEAFFF